MINHKYKCIFIHINKCAGTTIDNIFNGKNCGHKTSLQYREKYPHKFDSYFKFSFVRNPWSKMISFYRYHVRRNWDLNWDWNKNNAPSFKSFICEIYSYSPEKLSSIFDDLPFDKTDSRTLRISNSLDWLCDDHGKVIVDFIGKVEDINNDFAKVCEKINMQMPQLHPKNTSNHKHYTEYYDNETREIVAEKYAKDIEYFGYKFGE